MKTNLIRLGGLAAILAGILRALASLLPAPTAPIMTLYLVVDVLLLFSVIGLFEFQRVEAGGLGTLALLLEIVALFILIARDLSILGPAVYPAGALVFAVGLDLYAMASWRSRTLPRWILILLVLSTVIGPIGFFSPGLAVLVTASGILFGVGIASAGITISLPPRSRMKV